MSRERERKRVHTKIKKLLSQRKTYNWMLPQISYNIHLLQSTRVLYHNYNYSKISTSLQQCYRNSTQELMTHTPKTFQDIHIYFTKVKKHPDGIFTHIFFASSIILIFSRVFLRIISRLHKVQLNLLRVLTTEFAREKFRSRRDSSDSIKLIWKARKNPPKGHTKIVFCTISKDTVLHILSSIF